jgi:hypothetical protein
MHKGPLGRNARLVVLVLVGLVLVLVLLTGGG